MKSILHLNKLLILLVAGTISAMGQYTGSNPDVASSKLTSALDSIAGFEPSKAVDRSDLTYCKLAGDAPIWLQIDLGSYHYIDGFGMDLPNDNELPLVYTIQGSRNAAHWTSISEGTASASGPFSDDIEWPGDFSYIRILVTQKDAAVSITEFYVYGVKTVPPTAPYAKAATNITGSGFTAEWTDRVNATGYILSVATDVGFNDYVPGYENLDLGNVLTWDVTDLSPVTTYFYSVKAYNISGTSTISNIVSVSTIKQSQTITFDALDASIYGDPAFELVATSNSGLPVSFVSSDESVASISNSTVTIVGTGSANIIASQAGNAEFEAAPSVEQELMVNLKALSVEGAIVAEKEYDGLSDASISGGMLMGVVSSDDVVLANATSGNFSQIDVGTDIEVTTNMTLDGADNGNYSLTQPELTGNITAKELTVSGTIAADKVYDGNSDAKISGASISGVIGDDIVTLTSANDGVFAQSDVGIDIPVSTSMVLSGADADNYILIQPVDIVASITKKELIVTAEDKIREECETNPEFTIDYSGFVETEDESVIDPLPIASCIADESTDAGIYDITVAGGEAINYDLVYVNGTLEILTDVTVPELSVQNITVQLDESGNASITPADVVTDVFDACGVSDTTLTHSSFTTEDIGEVLVGVTAIDLAGNEAFATCTVTVEGPSSVGDMAAIGAKIYPNPTAGKLELITDTPIESLQIMDMTGKIIIHRKEVAMQESIDLSSFNNGIYVIQLQVGNDMIYTKVVKR